MSELKLVCELFPDQLPADEAARERVRAAVWARTIDRRRPAWQRARWFVSTAGVAAVGAVATAVVLAIGTGGAGTASAARLLRQAAVTARAQRSLATLEPGQYLYTKSTSEYMNSVALKSGSYAVMVPYVREVWLRRDGTGWVHQTSGAPFFLSEHDRQAWIAAGRPELGAGVMNLPLQNTDAPTAPMASLDLPSDPDALYARLQHDAAGFGSRMYAEMFTIIGDSLRENSTTPAQRAALFEVAARLPGITLIPATTDAAGRREDGVAIDDLQNRERLTLLFDPDSRALLGEEDSLLAGNFGDYPAGTVIGRAAYLEQAVVDSVPAAVVKGGSKG
jgi:hypothetical protein